MALHLAIHDGILTGSNSLTGTGIWATEFARSHPESHIIGTDLSTIQPPREQVPQNCEFRQEDSEKEWSFAEPLDYVHLRSVCTCFGNPKALIGSIYDHLRPGAWVEFQDCTMTMVGEDEAADGVANSSAMNEWLTLVVKGAAKFGQDLQKAGKYKQWYVALSTSVASSTGASADHSSQADRDWLRRGC